MRAQMKRGRVARLICHLEGWWEASLTLSLALSLVRVRSDPGSDFLRPNMAGVWVLVWGCGIEREVVVMIDTRDGEV